jgi:tripartite-type tricarboxylate transporter receptor subunit TctC
MTRLSNAWLGGAVALTLLQVATAAVAQEPWTYHGKAVSIFVGASAGGGYDFYARLLARHIGKHLPGNPTVIVKNMPGAGAIVLANHLQTRAARDGTEFGALEHGTAFTSLLTGARAEFDPTNLAWLGSMEQFTPIVAVWHTSAIHSADDLTTKPMTVGSSGAGSTTSGYPHSLNAILGTKMKVIGGYPGSAEINLAIERGELDGVASWCWTCAKAQKPHWIADNKLRVVLQLAPVADAELKGKGIPTVFEWAKSDEQRQMLNIVFGSVGMSRPFAAPPELPPERLAMLRRAFAQAVQDPELVADAAQKNAEVMFVAPDVVETLIKNAYAANPELIVKVRAAYSGK